MDEPLPVGLGLRVPPPTQNSLESTSLPTLSFVDITTTPVSTPAVPKKLNISEDGLCEFDELDLSQVRIYTIIA